jgi:hypothetical protein
VVAGTLVSESADPASAYIVVSIPPQHQMNLVDERYRIELVLLISSLLE